LRGEALQAMRKYLVVTSLFLATGFALAGTLSGTVKEKSTEITLPNARVAIMNTTFSTIANLDGMYSFKIPDGTYLVKASFSGFSPETQTVTVSGDTKLNFTMVASNIEEEVVVTANRAVIRETPVAFTNVSGDTIKEKYTTQDTPELLKAVPGVFSRSAGLGEADLFVRGFDSERVQIMINNVPVNDPESQVVYWSNWTGLSGNAGSIQVQKGVGSSLYGSGAFGGSVNIETDNFKVESSKSFLGTYASMGDNSHYIAAADYSTGYFNNDKMNFFARYERKDGDSYIDQTGYDGHSFYFGLLYQVSESQSWTINLHGAPQDHHQAANVQDPRFLSTEFGYSWGSRTWNRRSHPYQENYYFKPVLEAHHDWTIDSSAHWRTTFFATTGTGGGKYLRNDNLNLDDGMVYALSNSNQFRHSDRNYNSGRIFGNGFLSDSQSNHHQFGFNTSYKKVFNEKLTMVVGGELRLWDAEHVSYSDKFEFGDEPATGLSPQRIENVEDRYNYDGIVDNYSVFARLQWSPVENITIMADVGYLNFDQSIEEVLIRQYDFYNRQWTDIYARFTADELDNWDASDPNNVTADVVANPAADPSYYSREYSFVQPKFGINWNVNDNWNVFANYSQASKEPQVGDWYNRSSPPLGTDEIDQEELKDFELGISYRTRKQNLSVNIYRMAFEDKIESVTDSLGNRETINAGDADHDGIEIAYNLQINNNLSWIASGTFANNEWTRVVDYDPAIDYDNNPDLSEPFIFGLPAGSVYGKKVPDSPQTIVFTELAYHSKTWFGYVNYNHWDDYYALYNNSPVTDDEGRLIGLDADGTLPTFSEVGLGIGYNMDVGGDNLRLSLRGNNITGHDHYVDASYSSDYGRDGGRYLGVTQAPKAQIYLTVDYSF
jgi:outer membrane receptor protein involved in Fe transport